MTLIPVVITVCLLLCIPTTTRFRTGIGLAAAWNATALIPVNLIAVGNGWWTFHDTTSSPFRLPLDLMCGWAILWGATLFLAFQGKHFITALLTATFFDLIVMPLCAPVITLGEGWLWGELIALCLCFAPGWWLASATVRDQHVGWRASLQVMIAGFGLLWLLPSYALSLSGKHLSEIIEGPAWRVSLVLNTLLIPCVLGLAATQELATRGRGTPFPFDPPKDLVTTGPYAYLRNPIQTCTFLVLLLLAIALNDIYLLASACVALIYFAGIARWHHLETAEARFGGEVTVYHRHVRDWIPHWRPWIMTPSTIYFARSCEICGSTERLLRKLNPIGLTFEDAANHPTALRRVAYRYPDEGEVHGIEAIASALSHVNFAWALLGWCMRLPIIRSFLQIIADGSAAVPSPTGIDAQPDKE
jgi:protein-S-isoprenylcysteine O-methyltransferase Ste14